VLECQHRRPRARPPRGHARNGVVCFTLRGPRRFEPLKLTGLFDADRCELVGLVWSASLLGFVVKAAGSELHSLVSTLREFRQFLRGGCPSYGPGGGRCCTPRESRLAADTTRVAAILSDTPTGVRGAPAASNRRPRPSAVSTRSPGQHRV
jgi:hypothetical protein